MAKNCLYAILALVFLIPSISLARPHISGEMEWQFDGDGGRGFSQYLWLDTEHSNFVARYAWVEKTLEQGEFAIGPTFPMGGFTVKLWAGATTEKSVMLGGSLAGSVWEHDVLYILDPKISTNELPDALYQKLFVALDKKGSWQFRIESLQVAGNAVFVRTGVEYELTLPWLPESNHLFIHPFFDPQGHNVGIHVGCRFFNW